MIFARRALQKCLNELREALPNDTANNLVVRLNRPGKDRLAAMWEVVILQALTKMGTLYNELPLSSGRCPDISFDYEGMRLVADITTVSDEGLDNDNPYEELSRLIEEGKNGLGLPIGGIDLNVKSKDVHSARGTKVFLRLPPRKELRAFVQSKILPELRSQIAAGKQVLQILVDEEDGPGFELVINPKQSPYSSIGFASYTVPTIKDRNPLYNAMKAKVTQLRGARGLTGLIVCDGDCAALAEGIDSYNRNSANSIAEEFLRQYSSIDFVSFLTVREKTRSFPYIDPTTRWLHSTVITQHGFTNKSIVNKIIENMLVHIPKPVMMPINGARRAREKEYYLGQHGAYELSERKIRVSSRELMEILAGLRTFGDNGAMNVEASRKSPREPNQIENAFKRNLISGKLPSSINVNKCDENDSDDWVEFEFNDADPAISPFK